MRLDVTQLALLHQRVNAKQAEYIEVLKPLFFPRELTDGNILEYFASLLRVVGMEDSGWDPYAESREVIRDMTTLLSSELSEELFPDTSATRWRFALLLYSHIVEMDGPYDVLANLLRIQSHKGYSPFPFLQVITKRGTTVLEDKRLLVADKIEIITKHAADLGYPMGAIFADYYDSRLRNALAHSDYTLATEGLRCRGRWPKTRSLIVQYPELLDHIACAIAFVLAFLHLETGVRYTWGKRKGEAMPYDRRLKGLLEILVDDEDRMCGFAVHWPNEFVSVYRRTATRVDMINCHADPESATISPTVGLYARNPGTFSPLVEHDAEPAYTKLDVGSKRPTWPD